MSFVPARSVAWALVALWTLGPPAVAQGTPVVAPETAPLIQASFEQYTAGDFERSLQTASEAARLDPTSAVAYNNICCAQIRLRRYGEAIAACTEALRIEPGYSLAYGNLVWAYGEAADHEPTVETLLGLGALRYWRGDLDGCVAASRRALEIDPASAGAYNNICSVHARREEWDAAIASCEKALTLDPDFTRARNNLNWARAGKAGRL